MSLSLDVNTLSGSTFVCNAMHINVISAVVIIVVVIVLQIGINIVVVVYTLKVVFVA